MNVETGEIIPEPSKEQLLDESKKYVPVAYGDMTNLQRLSMQVQLKDNRSRLGRQRVASVKKLRKKRKLERQRRRNAPRR